MTGVRFARDDEDFEALSDARFRVLGLCYDLR